MPAKIKSNDDRIQTAAIAVLLLARERMSRAQAHGLITPTLRDYRDDYAGYKAAHPDRTLTAARESGPITNAARYQDYLKLVAAMETVLARIARHKTQFNSLLELDNYLAASLKAFD